MNVVIASLGSVVLVSLVSLVGLFTLSMNETRVRRLAKFFVSFAVGALLGDSFIHLIPETFARAATQAETLRGSLIVLAGILLFFIVEKFVRHRHGMLHEHHHVRAHVAQPELATVNVLGDAIHNFIDGVLIGASYLASSTLGVTTTVAVFLHEVPQELGDFGILVHSGLSVRNAVLLNLASASLAILGTALALLAGAIVGESVVGALIPVTAGGFVYLAAADLVPELQQDRSWRALFVQTSLIAFGIGVMGLLSFAQ